MSLIVAFLTFVLSAFGTMPENNAVFSHAAPYGHAVEINNVDSFVQFWSKSYTVDIKDNPYVYYDCCQTAITLLHFTFDSPDTFVIMIERSCGSGESELLKWYEISSNGFKFVEM